MDEVWACRTVASRSATSLGDRLYQFGVKPPAFADVADLIGAILAAVETRCRSFQTADNWGSFGPQATLVPQRIGLLV